MSEIIVLIEPDKIIVDEDRYRKDMGDIAALADSIKTLGKNIIPIAVTVAADQPGMYKLVAGERRTRACKLAGVNVRAIIYSLDDIEHRIYEITENLERKDFDWREKALATTDLIDMLKAKYKKMPLRKASEKTGLSVGTISTDLGLAEALKTDPDMFSRCKTRDSALKILQKYKLDEVHAELSIRKKKTNYGKKAQNYIFNGSCIDLIDNLPDGCVSALITDPPYGIDLANRKKQTGEGNEATKSGIYQDDVEGYFVRMDQLFTKLGRVMAKDSCFAFFCDVRPRNITWISDKFINLGYDVDEIPAIWFRTGSPGQTSQPAKNFARSYELFLYGTRGDYALVKKGQPNVLPFAGVPTSDKMHIVQKPQPLMEELVNRFCLPGQIVLDPFAGSATTIIAGLKAGCKPIGFEMDKVNYDRALVRIADFLYAKDTGMIDKMEAKK